MKVLLISASPINMTTSIGNTFLNIMPDNIELSSIYTRSGLPDKRIKNAFCITERMLIRLKKGRVVDDRYHSDDYSSDSIPEFAKKHRFSVFFIIRDLIWRVFNWKTSALTDFIKKVNADVIFTVSTNQIFLNRIISYVAKNSEKPLMVYAWDNNYFDNPYEKNIARRIMHKSEKSYMKNIICQSQKIFVISPIQKKDYDEEFSVDSVVLTKYDDFSADFEYLDKNEKMPLELVYTGNLGIKRYDTISEIVNALKIINKDGTKAVLKIYSGTTVTENVKNTIDDGENSFFMGSVSADRITNIQKNADILVHVEGFDNKTAFQIKYSFSTKIVDYLKSCRPIFAVGPENVASIDYFIQNDSAVVASSKDSIYNKLKLMIENSEIRKSYAKKAYICGKANHDKSKTEDMFIKILSGTQR